MSTLRLPAILTLGALVAVAPAHAGTPSETHPALDALQPSQRDGLLAALDEARHTARPVDGVADRLVARNLGQRWSLAFDARGLTVVPDAGAFTWGLELRAWGVDGARAHLDRGLDLVADGRRVERHWDAGLVEWYLNDERGVEHGFTLTERPAGDTTRALVFELAVRGDLEPAVSANGRDVDFVDAHGTRALSYDGLVAFDRDGDHLPAAFRVDADGDLVLSVDDRGADYPITIDPVAQQQVYLKASNAEAEDRFGFTCSVFGNTVAIGAPVESSAATGIDGDQELPGVNGGTSGAVYIFSVDGSGVWSQDTYIKASNTGLLDQFGSSVCLHGDTLVVGAPFEKSAATGVNGNQADDSAIDAGAAYVFVRNGGVWSQQAYLKAHNTQAFDAFGTSVAVFGDTIAVGAPFEDSSTTGVNNGGRGNNAAQNAGAVYLFERAGTNWTQTAYVKGFGTSSGAGDHFGQAVALGEDVLAVGAPGYSPGFDSQGALFVYERNGGVWAPEADFLHETTVEAFDDRFGAAVALQGDTIVAGAPFEDDMGNTPESGAAYVYERIGGGWGETHKLKASNAGPGDRFGSAVAVDLEDGGQVRTIMVGAPFERSASTGFDGPERDNSVIQAGAVYVFREAYGGPLEQIHYVKASNTDIGDQYGTSMCLDGTVVVVGAPVEASAGQGIRADQGNNRAGGAGAAYGLFIPLPEPPQPPTTCVAASVLVYPYQRSALGDPAVFNVISVTNVATAGDCTTDVHFQYVNVGPSPNPFTFADCSISDRVETLTPADTLSVLTGCHNGAQNGLGYLVVSAMDPNQLDTYWSFNYLIGSEQIISPNGGIYSLRPWDFCALVPDKTNTDLDGDGSRDFDGLEYDPIADELYLDTFAGSNPGELILLSFLGGEYLNQVDFVIFNDDEFQMSAQHYFACWTRVPLGEISAFFTTQGLLTTPTDPDQLDLTCNGVKDEYTGWAIIRPVRALSITSDNIEDPAILGAITNDFAPWMGARLLWESTAKQTNGQFPGN